MRLLRTVSSDMKQVVGEVSVVEWTASDSFPRLGKSVGIDTETELITGTTWFPPVVVLGCYDNDSRTCYVVYWQDIPAFMTQLCKRDIEQRYFNLGFDEGVIDNELENSDLRRTRGRICKSYIESNAGASEQIFRVLGL